MRKTMCNECRYTFALKEESIETECIDIDRKIERQFFKCPNCGHKYTILITDQPMRDMINQRRAIQIRVAQLMNGKNKIRKYKDLKKQDDDLTYKIKKRGQQLKAEYEKGSFTE